MRILNKNRVVITVLALTSLVSTIVLAQGSSVFSPLSEDPLRPSGQNVIPLFDGWFQNEDQSYTLCFGYFNMNIEQALDIPLGPDNRIEPAEFDGLQPTHFDPVPAPELTRPFRHHWCVFSVQVPADFGTREVIWSLTSQGDELSVPGWILPSYVLDEPSTDGRGASAPWLSLDDNEPNSQGRRGLWVGPRTVAVGEPLSLIARIRHPEAGTWLGWTLHQGPGQVEFASSEQRLNVAEGVVNTSATFSTPGSYVLRVQTINDVEQQANPTYGFEFHCCWTNGYVRVEVIE